MPRPMLSGPGSLFALLILVLSLPLLACGGGGGGSSSGGGAVAATGSTSIFLTDAPSDRFDEILITLESIALICDGPNVEIFSGSETIDLKDLENFSDLFVHAEEVPVGICHKIRLGLSRIELVDGSDRIEVDPPANNRLDLLSREPFEVREGRNLVVELDIDAHKSIHIVGTGQGRYRFRPIVRVLIRETLSPDKLSRVHGEVEEVYGDGSFELCSTVFLAAREDGRSSRRHGGLGDLHRCMTVELDDGASVFDSNGDATDASSISRGDELTVVGHFHIVDGNHDEIIPKSSVAATRPHFDHLEDFISELSEKLAQEREREDDSDSDSRSDSDSDSERDTDKDSDSRKGSDSDKDSDSGSDTDKDSDSGSDSDSSSDRPGGGDRPPPVDFVLVAYVVELGPVGTFLNLSGVIESEPDALSEFDFAVDPGQGFGDSSVLVALLQDETQIFDKAGNEVGEEAIVPDTPAEIDGVLESDARGSYLKSALIVLGIVDDGGDGPGDGGPGDDGPGDGEPGDGGPPPEPSSLLRGEVVSTDAVERRMDVAVTEGGPAESCVDVPEEAEIASVLEGSDGSTVEPIAFEEIARGQQADVYGNFVDGEACFLADNVIVFPLECEREVDCPSGQFCSRLEFNDCTGPGVCRNKPQSCTTEVDRVCACDGRTYDNACEANASGLSVAYEDACVGEPRL
jgi:hypothetical protein